jgi:hypothetical protein
MEGLDRSGQVVDGIEFVSPRGCIVRPRRYRVVGRDIDVDCCQA